MEHPPSLVALFVAPINRSGIEYMVTGGLAAVIYGHPTGMPWEIRRDGPGLAGGEMQARLDWLPEKFEVTVRHVLAPPQVRP